MRAAVSLALLLAGCGVTASSGGGGNHGTTDAPSATAPDAPGPPPGTDAPPAATCSNGRTIYLNFDGTTLTKAAPSDATQKHASWMTATPGTIPAWNAASANRANDIATIVAGVRAALSTAGGFPGAITVTTTQPATGPYVMVVYGGTSAQSHSSYSQAVNTLDCSDTAKSDVAWIRDAADPVNTTAVINTTLGAIGFGLGLTATTDPSDCMCSWANNCVKDQSTLCTLHDGIARDPQATQLCAGATATQDEHAAFATAFCQ